MTSMPAEIKKFVATFACPKCASDKCSTRLDTSPETSQDHERRKRIKWPTSGELMVQTCSLCGHVQISRPLDYSEQVPEGH